MASLTAASLSVPSFCGLRASDPSPKLSPSSLPFSPIRAAPISASLSDRSLSPSSAFVAAAAAATVLAAASSPALAATVQVGDEDGNFVFSPSSLTVSAGEVIEFKGSGDVDHNVIFDIPAGAPPSLVKELTASSMGENDYIQEGSSFTAKLSTPGTYSYYCTPHRSANMTGVIVVK